MLTDNTGRVVGTVSYDAYGAISATTGVTAPLGYDGQYQDTESGLIYLRHRYYDPTTAQFLTEDPAGSISCVPYSYASSDPLDETDPTGMYVDPLPQAPRAAAQKRAVVVGAAEAYLGFPYVWAGGDANGPTYGKPGDPGGKEDDAWAVTHIGFDCSGLVKYAYAQAGINLPHYSGAGGDWSMGKPVTGALLPGDLVFFDGAKDPQHIGIYIGGDKWIEAPQTFKNVRIQSVDNAFWKKNYVGARRIIP